MSAFKQTESEFVEKSGLRKLPRLTKYTDPRRFNSDEHLRDMFYEVIEHKASDIYISENKPISVLVDGKLFALTYRIIEKGESQWILGAIAGQTALTSITSQTAINTTYGLFDRDEKKITLVGNRVKNNFRVNVSGTRNQGVDAFQIVMRAIPSDPYPYHVLNLDERFVKRCCPPKGIVLIAGVTGSGKSTTLSSIIRYILENDTPIKGNLITHEEPIEFTYDNIQTTHSIIVQSQIPENFKSFGAANREAMRRKPALILLGELRDSETIESAVEASLTGHPVFGTVHSSAVTEIIPRLLAQFPPSQKSQALFDIISTVEVLIAQRLIPKANGKLMAVQEYLHFTPAIRQRLLEIDDPLVINRQIHQLMAEGQFNIEHYSSPTFEVQGRKLFEEGVIDEKGLIYLTGSGGH